MLAELHNTNHFGVEKTYSLVQDRFFWPNMFKFVSMFVGNCETCQKTKCDTSPPKAPLLPMVIPSAPMQFVSLDIAHMPTDSDGYRYMLLVGDIFSKYIDAIPLRDQTAKSVVNAFSSNWLYIHGNPYYLSSDQGSNVDGDVVRSFCDEFGIEKRRSSAYHSQGNGFAERNIRSVKDMLRAALLHRNLDQSKWRKLLPELVFALNCSASKAIQCIPYKVVFGRVPTLPIDIHFGVDKESRITDVITAAEYFEERSFVLQDMFDVVIRELNLSKLKMMRQYNKNLQFNDYQKGDEVWLKVKYYKTGENQKLAPRRGGPWTVIEKLPNGVNFRIRNKSSAETRIVHHDRLSCVVEKRMLLCLSHDEAPKNLCLMMIQKVRVRRVVATPRTTRRIGMSIENPYRVPAVQKATVIMTMVAYRRDGIRKENVLLEAFLVRFLGVRCQSCSSINFILVGGNVGCSWFSYARNAVFVFRRYLIS